MDSEASRRFEMTPRFDVLGVEVSAVDRVTAVELIGRWIAEEAKTYVCVTGVHGVIESQRDQDLMRIHNDSGMTTPDGMPLVWCGRYAGADPIERVYGPELVEDVCSTSIQLGWSHYFYGAAPGVAEELARNLSTQFPGLKVVGTESPPFGELTHDEMMATADRLNSAGPDIVWVGLSTPKQERWMDRFRPLLKAPVLVGVGAAFDFHAGRIPQAPSWMQRSGLEWSYRLMREPKRLWRRYLTANPQFVKRILTQRPRMVESPVANSAAPRGHDRSTLDRH